MTQYLAGGLPNRNFGDAVKAVVVRHHACLLDDAGDTLGTATPPLAQDAAPLEAAPAVLPPRPTTSQQTWHATVHALVARGLGVSAIARTLDLDRKTVRRYVRATTPTAAASPRHPRGSRLDPFTDYLRRRWQEGCRNASRLFTRAARARVSWQPDDRPRLPGPIARR